MGGFRDLLARIGKREEVVVAQEVVAQKQLPVTIMVGNNHSPVRDLIDYQAYNNEGYNRNAVVWACVREIARSAPSALMQVAKEVENVQIQPDHEHPLHAVLMRPNPHQSQVEFLELLYTYLQMDGNAFVVLVKKGKRTQEMYLLRPDRMFPVPVDRWLAGYVYMNGIDEPTTFEPENVIHIKFPNPLDPYEGLGRGTSPLSSAAIETDIDNRAGQFMKSFFDNAAVPYGLLRSKNVLDEHEITRIRNRLKDQYGGDRNWNEIMILDADAEYQRMGLDVQEMAFPDLRALSETRICAAFKVPPVLLGIKAGLDASTYSNYTQARRALWEDNIVPSNNKIAAAFTAAMRSELGKDGIVNFDYSMVTALSEDRNARFTRANQAVIGGWIMVNEARREIGLAPVADGNVFLRSLAMSTNEQVTAPVKEPEQEPEKGRKGDEPVLTIDVVWGAYVKRFDRVARAHEMRYFEEARRLFRDDAAEITAILEEAKREKRLGAEKALDYNEILKILLGFIESRSNPKWAAGFGPLFAALLLEQSENWLAILGDVWRVTNPMVAEFIQSYAFRFAERLGETTVGVLRNFILQAQVEGFTSLQVIDGVRGLYSGWDFNRAEMIARSETIRASNAGAVEAYKLGGIRAKQWYAAEDDRTCGFCWEKHETIVGVADNFGNYGDVLVVDGQKLILDYEDVGYPPLHPDCRCTVLPVIE